MIITAITFYTKAIFHCIIFIFKFLKIFLQASEQDVALFTKLKEKGEQLEASTPAQETPMSPDPTSFLGVPTPASL